MAQIFQAMLLGPWMSKTGGKKMGAAIGETKPKGSGFSQRASGSRQSRTGYR